jgi:predicted nuclease with RNAse H fold
MADQDLLFIGIDPSGSVHPFTCAVLNEQCQLEALASFEIDEVISFINQKRKTVIAINAPQAVNSGLVRKKFEAANLHPGQLRGLDMRVAEHELREHGIYISPTPSRREMCSPWLQMGMQLYDELQNIGGQPLSKLEASIRWIETHPHAAYSALLGHLPLPKPSLEGRLQRQLVLFECNLGINDPMEYFEEVTRHRILSGNLPKEMIYSAEELDALVAAYTAYLLYHLPNETTRVGDVGEGQIIIPVKELKVKYS